MKVERELCSKCLHLQEYHFTRALSGKQFCVFGCEIHTTNEVLKPSDEKRCRCRKFEP